MQRERSIPSADFTLVAEHAMQPGVIALVLERMGFERFLGPLPRAGVSAFDGGYLRVASSAAAAVRAQYSRAQAELWAAHRRRAAAEHNRLLGERPVMLLVRNGSEVAVWFDMASGEWRDISGAVAGEDIISLGAVMWQCRHGLAAYRCARIAGLEALPRVRN